MVKILQVVNCKCTYSNRVQETLPTVGEKIFVLLLNLYIGSEKVVQPLSTKVSSSHSPPKLTSVQTVTYSC